MYIESIDENKELLRKVLHDYVNTLSEDQLRSMLISNEVKENIPEEKDTTFSNYPQD